jgi:hypothetical protein
MTGQHATAAGELLAAVNPLAPAVELGPNPRSRPRCECGSGRPTVWLLNVHGQKYERCYSCFADAWHAATEAAFR